MNPDELQERTKQFAIRIMKLVDALPKTTAGYTIGRQIIRSGTSVSANYRAARRARSKKEFAAKIGVVAEEADETAHWLELIVDGKIVKRSLVSPLWQEAEELTRIFAKSRQTAVLNNRPK